MNRQARKIGWLAVCLATGACSVGSSRKGGETPTEKVSQPLASLACSNGSYILNYDAADESDWNRIAALPSKPVFIIVDDHRVDLDQTNGVTPVPAATWFHNHSDPAVRAIKVVKYIPMNYSRSSVSTCPTVYDANTHSECDNAPTNGSPNCGPIAITDRISRALADGFDGVFFDETAPPASVDYVHKCAALVKAADPNKIVIINPGSFPGDLTIFNDDIDMLALENGTVDDVITDARIAPLGIDATRWLGIQQVSDQDVAGTNLFNFRMRGGFWYYGTNDYTHLPPPTTSLDWLSDLTQWGNSQGRPDCNAPAAPSGCGFMTAGQGLVSGTHQQALVSCSGQYAFIMQQDGNLVLYNNGAPEWASNTDGFGPATARLDPNGNLNIYRGFGSFTSPFQIWTSNTYGQSGAWLAMQDDGNVVLYDANNIPIWSLKNPQWPTGCGVLSPGQGITPTVGSAVVSCNGRYALRLQSSGELDLMDDQVGRIWNSPTNGIGNIATAVMQGDGNFVIYQGYNPPNAQWASNTWGTDGAALYVHDDGRLTVELNGAVLHQVFP